MTNEMQQLKYIATGLSVLYVEDYTPLRNNLKTYLEKFFSNVDTAADGREGLDKYKKGKYDIVISDIKMPKLDGLEMANEIKKINPNQNILIVSAYTDISNFTFSIKIGIDGYIVKPIDYKQLNQALFKVVYKIKQVNENENYKTRLEELVEEKTKETIKLQEERVKDYQNLVYSLVTMIENRDTYTGGHSQRVAEYSILIAKELNFDEKRCENIYQAAVLHDIGKIAIPDTILLKPGNLTEFEYSLIKQHVKLGIKMLKGITMCKDILPIIESHHERFDGSGYPNGLKGNEIPIEAQILSVADTFDAMTTSRIYKHKVTKNKALDEIDKLSNIHYSSHIVEAAKKVLKNVNIQTNIDQFPTDKFEEERFSYFYKDQLTGSYNINYLDIVLKHNHKHIEYYNLYLVKIHKLDKYSWEKGNEYLSFIAKKLMSSFNNSLIFRINGNHFIILTQNDKINKNDLDFINCEDITFDIHYFDIFKNNIYSLNQYIKLEKKI
ncbi:MAG: response regulator [Campylobacterota bacterium]|nr:response regulator [Campylobacterota bacterium]